MKKDLIIKFLNSNSDRIFKTFREIHYISLDITEGNIDFEIGSANGEFNFEQIGFNQLFDNPLKSKLNFDFSITNVKSEPIALYSNRNFNLTKNYGHTINVFYKVRKQLYGISSTHSLMPHTACSDWYVVESNRNPTYKIGKVKNTYSKFLEKDLSIISIIPEDSIVSKLFSNVTPLKVSSVKRGDKVECFGNGNQQNKKGKVKKEHAWFIDDLTKESYNNVIQTTDISNNGDSGSMVLKIGTNQIIGIVTGGERENSYITRIEEIKHKLFTINN